MITKHQKYIRLFFGGIVAAIVVVMVAGSTLFAKNNFIARGVDSLTIGTKTLMYRMQYDRMSGLAAASIDPQSAAMAQDGGHARALPVLLYHGIVNKPDRFSMTAETFKDQMFALKRAGYRTVTLAQAYDFFANRVPLPDKSILITFDDGRSDSYYGADPILRAAGFTAVMFVATQDSLTEATSAGDNYYLGKEKLKAMIDSGRWEIGSHAIQETGGFVPIDGSGTKGNFLSSRAWDDSSQLLEAQDQYKTRIIRELSLSRKNLEAAFGVPVTAFAYPFGDWGQQSANYPNAVPVIRSIVAENYDMAFRQIWQTSDDATFNYPGDDLLRLKRVEVDTAWSGSELVSFLESVAPKQIPYDAAFFRDTGWRQTWGTMEVKDSSMTLAATGATRGAETFLDGTKDWKNYIFTIDGVWNSGHTLTVMARYADGNNYAACTFEDGVVRAQEMVNGKKTTLGIKSIDKKLILTGTEMSFGIRVYDNEMQCLVNRQLIPVAYTLTRELSLGGIGVKIWDQAPGNSTLDIRSVHVVPSGQARVLQY